MTDEERREPIHLEVVRGEKRRKDLCSYCGGPSHKAVFACPRIYSVTYFRDGETEITFRDDFGLDSGPEGPKLAG